MFVRVFLKHFPLMLVLLEIFIIPKAPVVTTTQAPRFPLWWQTLKPRWVSADIQWIKWLEGFKYAHGKKKQSIYFYFRGFYLFCPFHFKKKKKCTFYRIKPSDYSPLSSLLWQCKDRQGELSFPPQKIKLSKNKSLKKTFNTDSKRDLKTKMFSS